MLIFIFFFRKLIKTCVLVCLSDLKNIRNTRFKLSLEFKQLEQIKKGSLSIFKRVAFSKS